jgi:hypothetical protein
MHGFEGFTRSQFDAAVYLDEYLRGNKIGSVRVVNAFKFHGKVYSFLKQQTAFAGIVGSSNLSSVLDNQNHYEADLFINEAGMVNEINNFIIQLSRDASVPIDGYEPKIIEGKNTLLEGHEGVEKPSKEDLQAVLLDRKSVSFEIPIKGAEEAPHSNLNVFFGKGRENKKGFVKPRSDYGGWYKSKLFRFRPRKRWYCPEHHDFGKHRDDHFYDRYKTPEPPVEEKVTESTTEELYKLLD